MKQLFVGIKTHLDNSLYTVLQNLIKSLPDDKINWTLPENMHITLRFIGETPAERIPDIENCLQKAANDSSSIAFETSKTGIFGSRHNPRVIWLGLSPQEPIQSLFSTIQSNLSQIGILPTGENFVPHLTLGRIRKINDKAFFQNTLESFETRFPAQHFDVCSFQLFESILLKSSPKYNIIKEFILNQ